MNTSTITRSVAFDLGRDTTRIKDPRDAARQHATVDTLLGRLFARSVEARRELQLLADEVGMGKTFVALGVAYSVLDWMRQRADLDDLAGCARKVLVVTPPNAALFGKWQREVGEFVKRCMPPALGDGAERWFAPAGVTRLDELAAEVQRPGDDRQVIVTDMNIFAGRRFNDLDLKRRVLLGQLFRLWGVRFTYQERERLLKGSSWGYAADSVDQVSRDERKLLHLSKDATYESLRRVADHAGSDGAQLVERLLEECRDIAAPYRRDRESLFASVEQKLAKLYRLVCAECIEAAIPLVIVDEAHNWKNGTNGFKEFVRYVGSRSRRVLLLTATPFQLRPAEMLEIMKVSDHLAPCPEPRRSRARIDELRRVREDVVRPVLDASARASQRFQRAWSRLPRAVTGDTLLLEWNGAELTSARARLRALAMQVGPNQQDRVHAIASTAVADVDPDRREFLREALHLYAYNADLSHELGGLVIRHRRQSGHRLFRVGREHHRDFRRAGVLARPDGHLLHDAPGLDVQGDGELPHYLLMRCVSEMKGGRGRSSLGTALTGCYSTLLHSAEGKQVQQQLGATPAGRMYLDLLMRMVGEEHDPRHPKVQEVVDAVMDAWHTGEKTLIFCFRINTARRIREIVDARIRAELESRRSRCLGGEERLRSLRSRLTGRDRDLVTVGLDRVLWSFYRASTFGDEAAPFSPEDLRLSDDDLGELARLSLTYDVDLMGERVDRVFLHRATEHVIARRLLRDQPTGQEWTQLLRRIAAPDESWIAHPYGLEGGTDGYQDDDSDAEDRLASSERGVHTVYTRRAKAGRTEVRLLAGEVRERRDRARRQKQLSVFDVYAEGPSLWFGRAPEIAEAGKSRSRDIVEMLHAHLARLSYSHGEYDWAARRVVLEALRRALLRESVLLRLLPDRDADDEGMGVLLVEAFHSPLPGQRECMADRMGVFLEDLASASGHVLQEGTARHALLDATRLRDQQFVALVTGGSGGADAMRRRERVFAGFNTPLLPEVLVCTSVGQEGIDLHRHCRHVIHYDLAWNPAVIEQRTGRVDRIGSQTFRERRLGLAEECQVHLEIGVPFLAGTYDERMYEELRLRAQTFEVLTGGDFAVDNPEGADDLSNDGAPDGSLGVVLLPKSLVDDLRVNLHVWSASERAPAG